MNKDLTELYKNIKLRTFFFYTQNQLKITHRANRSKIYA